MPSEGIQGDEWGTKVALARMTGTNAGSPKGRESYGDGGLVVAAGVTTGREVRESRNEGDGGQGTGHSGTWEVCEIAERRNSSGYPP